MQKINTLVVIPNFWLEKSYHDTIASVEAEIHSNFGHHEIIVKKMCFVGYQAFQLKPYHLHDLMELIDQRVMDAFVNAKLNMAESHGGE